jgi:hypothetical protein
VSAGRSGYLSLRYGQSRPLEQGKPLVVLDGQIVANIDFALPRERIAGRITDETGQPMSGVRVFFLRPASPPAPPGVRRKRDTDDSGPVSRGQSGAERAYVRDAGRRGRSSRAASSRSSAYADLFRERPSSDAARHAPRRRR